MRSLFLGAALAVALSTPALAVTTTESTDFTNAFPPFNMGPLDLGANSISGSIAATCDETFPGPFGTICFFIGDTGDFIGFNIGAGLQLSAASLTITNLTTSGSAIPVASGRSGTGLRNLDLTANGVFDVLPLSGPVTGAQNFGVAPDLFGDTPRVDDTISFNWRLDLTVTAAAPVSAVPLPAGMPLLLAGLGGLAVLRRRTPRA